MPPTSLTPTYQELTRDFQSPEQLRLAARNPTRTTDKLRSFNVVTSDAQLTVPKPKSAPQPPPYPTLRMVAAN